MPVSIVKYDETPNALRRAIELCNGFEKLKSHNKVLLKPNIVYCGGTRKQPPYGMVTTSRIVENLIQLLLEQGCKDISIGEGTVEHEELGSNTSRGYRIWGIEKVAKRYGVKLIDFNKGSHKKVDFDGTRIGISDFALESDFLINLPVLKTHAETKISLGLKNLKGCLDMASRKEFHKKDLDQMIALLNTQVKPKLTIIDGIYALERGPITGIGTPCRMNLIIAGKDALSCDIVGSTVIGFEPSSIGHLKEFASISKRSLDLHTIDVRGENIKDVTKKLEWENDFEDIFRQTNIKGVTFQSPGKHLCSSCIFTTCAAVVIFCKDNNGITLDNVEICCDPDLKPRKDSKKVFLIGNCTIQANKDLKNAIRVKGCPPNAVDTLISLMSHTLDKERTQEILMIRSAQTLPDAPGIYEEDFPAFYKPYGLPEFDKKHF